MQQVEKVNVPQFMSTHPTVSLRLIPGKLLIQSELQSYGGSSRQVRKPLPLLDPV